MRIYVGNLPFSTTDDSLRSLFESHGAVTSAAVIIDRETGRSRGFGFVEMNDSDGRAAIEALNGQDLEGRALVVNEAKERAPRSGGFGGGGGGRGGYGGGGAGRIRRRRSGWRSRREGRVVALRTVTFGEPQRPRIP